MSATTTATPNADAVARFAASARSRNFPPEVLEAARMCLVDWVGVALGAHAEEAGLAVRRAAARWRAQGGARILLGGSTAPAVAALVNGTMAHCLDFDDTHVPAVAHLSAPIWAATLAVGFDRGSSERDMLAAFVSGFEAGARIGWGLGDTLNTRGIHSTGVWGCIGAAVAAGVLMELDEDGMRRAVGSAATQTGGLTGSFGTMMKPLHAGKAAMNGVLAAEFAAEGASAALDMVEERGGLVSALVQDGAGSIRPVDFGEGWEVLANTFKPYASCLLTHPVIDAARKLAAEVGDREIASVRAEVNPVCVQLAGKPRPTTPLEGKFSTAFCTALGLTGHSVGFADFVPERVADPRLQGIVARVELAASPAVKSTAARLRVALADGTTLEAETPLALGNPGNPMSWDDMHAKFTGLVEPVLGARAGELYELLRDFDRPGRRDALSGLLAAS